ncbi:hypothetical protein KDW_28060 [Dictyobacter vulcani]|uniref:Uncharacterized protein n=1 Tax=Dictyobacter vulcani TaxID=2607529 RepID=A0A5J4KGP6_9CHLR|nr:hypothetical protein KDW_28060 [Dictyobacter vulcani]
MIEGAFEEAKSLPYGMWHLDEDVPCMYNHACIAMSILQVVEVREAEVQQTTGPSKQRSHKC